MLICHCHGVTDRTIKACAMDGARTVAQVGRRCGAGTGCGGCVGAIRDVLLSARRPLPMVSGPVAASAVLAVAG
ncbi:MAG: (2Fe-2S)-binding protein [Myxococcales bacterium]|nr:(2Fe-2S)-binding protein [Myxococcales bacterium]